MTPLSVIRRFARRATLGFAAAGAVRAPAPDRGGSSLPEPHHFRARIQSSRAFAAPLPGWPTAPRPREEFGRRGREPTPRRRAVVPCLGGPALPGPYHFRARIQSFQAFAA